MSSGLEDKQKRPPRLELPQDRISKGSFAWNLDLDCLFILLAAVDWPAILAAAAAAAAAAAESARSLLILEMKCKISDSSSCLINN